MMPMMTMPDIPTVAARIPVRFHFQGFTYGRSLVLCSRRQETTVQNLTSRKVSQHTPNPSLPVNRQATEFLLSLKGFERGAFFVPFTCCHRRDLRVLPFLNPATKDAPYIRMALGEGAG
jgi:hypothetical protein